MWSIASMIVFVVMGTLALVILAVLSGVLFLHVTSRSWAKNTQGGLLGEVEIDSDVAAQKFADKALEEAFRIFAEPSSNWQTMSDQPDLVVESRRITKGPYAGPLLLTRSIGSVKGDADEIFNFLTSPEGFHVLDPMSDPAEMNQHILAVDWKKDSKLHIAESFLRNVPPGYAERHHVVLNAYDVPNRRFVCKSIIHKSRPGASVYYTGELTTASIPAPDDERVRATATFAIEVIPEVSQGQKGSSCTVRMINHTDMRLGPAFLMNWAVGKGFFPGVYERLAQVSAKKTQ